MQKINVSAQVQDAKSAFSNKPSLSLRIGEVLDGKVLQVLSSKMVMIQFKNQVIEARTEMPLKVGALARFEVLSTEGEIRLKRLPSPSKAEAVMAKALQNLQGSARSHSEIYRAFSQLKNLPEAILSMLPDFSILNHLTQGPGLLSGETLRALLEASGLTFENKLKKYILNADPDMTDEVDLQKTFSSMLQSDLKGTLLKMKSQLKEQVLLDVLTQHKVKPSVLNEAIETLLFEIGTQQLQSKLNHSRQFFIPFLWEGLKDGKLVFRKSGGECALGQRKKPDSCVIHLELEKAGKIRTQVQLISGQFHIDFVADNAQLTRLLHEGSETLRAQFKKAGLKWGDMSVRHQKNIDFDRPVKEGIDTQA